MSAYELYPCGDHAYTLDFGQQIDPEINRFIIRIFHQLQKEAYPYILDIIPAYSSITIVYDALKFSVTTDPAILIGQCFTAAMSEARKTDKDSSTRVIRIPVCYHPSLAPDLETVCDFHQMDIDTLISLHTQKTYRVFMNGFLPGFAYMGSVDQCIVTPRHTTPRKLVPEGSVGIAGEQTGIYPFASPGGWQLIGRTTVKLFDPSSITPCMLQPGDEVQFYSIPIENFTA